MKSSFLVTLILMRSNAILSVERTVSAVTVVTGNSTVVISLLLMVSRKLQYGACSYRKRSQRMRSVRGTEWERLIGGEMCGLS
jgi:hypothetical protein